MSETPSETTHTPKSTGLSKVTIPDATAAAIHHCLLRRDQAAEEAQAYESQAAAIAREYVEAAVSGRLRPLRPEDKVKYDPQTHEASIDSSGRAE